MSEINIETRQCKHCGVSFDITDQDIVFYDKVSPIFNNKKYQIPKPTFCPDCRQQRRLAWRNERKLYHGTCDFTGKKMISLYSPDKNLKVYHHTTRRSDIWDPMEYGRDFDFTKGFFDQFTSLHSTVPKISTYNKRTENTEYGNNVIEDKDCYLLYITFDNQNCYYGQTIGYCKNCVDSLWLIQCQNCYECIKAQNCYECFRCTNCQNCFSSQYLIDCVNVDSSAFCLGLRNKKYHFLNKVYSKSEYKEIIQRLEQDKVFLQETKDAFTKLKIHTPIKAGIIEQCENVSGDYLSNCKDGSHCFDTMMAENVKYLYDCANINDSMDQYLGGAEFKGPPNQLVYECENSVSTNYSCFCSCVALWSSNLFYCDSCDACKNCFACVGLRHKQYCIFNKQYTKEEYESLTSQIIEHMQKTGERGEFFPISISQFAYNETEAGMYYPLTKEQVENKGRKWLDEKAENKISEGTKVLQANELPNIQDASEDIVDYVIICEVSGKPFKIIKQELDFYRKYHLPLPRRHPDIRHIDRMHIKNPRKLRNRQCMKCTAPIQTSYAPDRPEIVYCEVCYNKEIYG